MPGYWFSKLKSTRRVGLVLLRWWTRVPTITCVESSTFRIAFRRPTLEASRLTTWFRDGCLWTGCRLNDWSRKEVLLWPNQYWMRSDKDIGILNLRMFTTKTTALLGHFRVLRKKLTRLPLVHVKDCHFGIQMTVAHLTIQKKHSFSNCFESYWPTIFPTLTINHRRRLWQVLVSMRFNSEFQESITWQNSTWLSNTKSNES